jgi:Cu/Ag efflux protein CusF
MTPSYLLLYVLPLATIIPKSNRATKILKKMKLAAQSQTISHRPLSSGKNEEFQHD